MIIRSTLRLLTIFSVVGLGLLGILGTNGSSERCETRADLWVGIDPLKPALGSIVWICPGEEVGLGWSTENASSASISPTIGAVDFEGLRTETPQEDTTYQLEAEGEQCSATDTVAINVIHEGDTVELTLNRPQTDKDTGFPVDLIWRGSGNPAFISPNVIATSVQLVSAGGWPTWAVRKTNPDGNVVVFDVGAQPTSPNAFPVQGAYEATPTNLTEPVAIADFDVTLRMTLRCKN